MTNSYRDKILDTFIRGLKGDLPRLLSIRELVTLPQVLHLCQKLDNMNFRLNYAHGANKVDANTARYRPPRHTLAFKGLRFYQNWLTCHLPHIDTMYYSRYLTDFIDIISHNITNPNLTLDSNNDITDSEPTNR